MQKLLPALLIGLIFVLSPLPRADEEAFSPGDKSVTNDTVTLTWNDAKKQVEISDTKGIYAVVPFGEDFLCGISPKTENEKSDHLFIFSEHSGYGTFIGSLPQENESLSLSRWLFVIMFASNKDGIDKNLIRFPKMELQLPQKTETLKSLGTAGLKTVDGHKGSYMFLSVADPETNAGVVSGWLSAKTASGIVFSGKTEDGKAFLVPESQYGNHIRYQSLLPISETFVIGRFDDCRDGLEQYAEMVAEAMDVHLKPIPAGYCTWYSDKHGGACDETHIRELADFAAEHLKPYGFNFVQIDDHWQDGIKTNGPKKIFTRVDSRGPYPNGMTPTANMLAEHGLTAGLWFMPFAGNVDDPHFPKEWYVKSGVTDEVNADGKSKRHYNSIANKEGEPYESFWGGTSLDMTNPDAQSYLRDTVEQIDSDWGYHYFKLDGLWTGMACDQLYVNNEYEPDDFGQAVFHNENFTPVMAYRKGFEIIREAAPEAFILGCNVSQNMRMMHPSIGYCDAMRIGPDNGSDWNSLKRGPWHGSNRYFLNGRVWWNDPDPVYVRASMPLEHAQLIASWVAVSGQLYAFSDWLPDLPKERLEILQKTIRPHGLTTARPVDLFESDLPRIWHLWDDQTGVRRDVVAFYNWDDKNAVTIETTAEKLGLPQAEQYVAFDFWGNEFVSPLDGKNIRVALPAGSCKVWSIRPFTDCPVLISTSQHVTQGVIDIAKETWDAEKHQLTIGIKRFNNAPLEMRIAVPDTMRFAEFTGDNATVDVQQNICVTIMPEATGEMYECVLTFE
ncbi:MAG: alpha-galactosidase [Planctomycetaceae bacterium]|nr:alpha-galactosidase [Planctomycetaceae bacterium]